MYCKVCLSLSLSQPFMLDVGVYIYMYPIRSCMFVFIFRCSGDVEVMQVPWSTQWRSQLMTSGFGCWTPRTITTLIPPSLPPSLMALWGLVSLSLHCWVCLRSTVIAAAAAAATTSLPNEKPGGPLDWLLSDKGPFHHSPEYIDFVEKNRQGFSTRYKIYRYVRDITTPIIGMTNPPAATSHRGCAFKDQLCVNKRPNTQ